MAGEAFRLPSRFRAMGSTFLRKRFGEALEGAVEAGSALSGTAPPLPGRQPAAFGETFSPEPS